MKRISSFALILAAIGAPAFASQGQSGNNGGGNNCVLQSVSVPGDAVSISYDPLEASATRAPFSLSLASTGCGSRSVPVRIDADDSNPQAASGSTIRLMSGTNQLEARIGDAGPGQGNGALVISISGDGTAVSSPLYLVLAPGQRVPPGVYTARMVAEVLPNNGAGNRDEGVTTSFDLIVTVQPLVGLAAATGTGLDLGQLREGATALSPVTFHAYANTNYTLKFTTDFDLNLLLGATRGQPAIPYIMRVNGEDVATNGRELSFANPGMQGFQAHELNVRLPALPLRPAGTYQDFITVEITAVF